MKKGAGKAKGSQFERAVCKALSLWCSRGVSIDYFWRSSLSGGRATVAKGKVRQAGDITAVAPEGHVLTNAFYIELKHLQNITLDSLIKGKGELIGIWNKTIVEASKYDRIPVLIFRQNHYPICFCTTYKGVQKLQVHSAVCIKSMKIGMQIIRFDDLMKEEFKL